MNNLLANWSEFRSLVCNLNEAGKNSLQSAFPPVNGWIAFMRNTLGMSRKNLAAIMNSKISIVQRDEYQEKLGQLKLSDLATYATPLYCKLSWTFQPNQDILINTDQSELVNLTTKQLNEIAESHDNQFMYALLPIKSIEHIRARHAIKVAKSIVAKVNDLMILENQALPPNKLREHKKYFVELILSQPSHKFWVVP